MIVKVKRLKKNEDHVDEAAPEKNILTGCILGHQSRPLGNIRADIPGSWSVSFSVSSFKR